MKIGFAGNTSAAYYCLEKLCRDAHEIKAIIVPHGEGANGNDQADFTSLAGEFDFKRLNWPADRREIEKLGLDVLIKLEWPENNELRSLPSLLTIGCNLAGQYYRGYLRDVAIDLYDGNSHSEIQLLVENRSQESSASGRPGAKVVAFSEIELDLLDDVRSAKTKAIISFYRLLKEFLETLAKNQKKPTTISRDVKIGMQKFERVLDWRLGVMKIHQIVRSLTYPGPGVQTWLDDSRLVIWRGHLFARSGKDYAHLDPGAIVEVVEELGVVVKAADGLFLITRIQPANAPELPAWVWANQFRIRLGEKFELKVLDKAIAAT